MLQAVFNQAWTGEIDAMRLFGSLPIIPNIIYLATSKE